MIGYKARPVIAWAITFLFLAAMPGCDSLKNYSEQELIQRAKDFESKGDLKAAVIELKNALQKNKNNAEARLLLGQIYVEAGDGNSAEKELLKAGQLGLNPESTKVYMGRALLLQEQFSKVLKEIQPTDKTSQGNLAKILQLHGDAYFGLGKIGEACASFTRAKEKDDQYIPTYWGLAKCFAIQGNVEQAKSQLDAALKLNEKNAETWVLVGDLESQRKNRQAARVAYLNAKKADANAVAAYLGLASLYVREHELGKAESELKEARKVAPRDLRPQYMQAFVAFQQKKYAEAADQLQGVFKAEPDHMPSLLLSGQVAFSLGNYEKAEADLSKFLAKYPHSIFAKKVLAASFLRSAQAQRALNILKPVLAEETKDAVLFELAGEASMAMKEYGKATEYFEKAAAINPKSAAVRIQLGVNQLAKGDSDRAVIELESAVALEPTQHKADTILAQIYLARKDYAKALQAIAALEKKQPRNPVTFNLKGAAYLGNQDFDNARKNFERALALQPTYVTAAMNLAQLDLREKHPEMARKRLEGMLEKEKNNLPVMMALAELMKSQGKENEYVDWLDRAAKANPTAIQPRELLVRYYIKNNKAQKALILAREAQAANPENPEALDLLGSTQFSAGEKDNALATYKKFASLAPTLPFAYYKLAALQAATNDTTSAKATLKKALELKPDFLDAQTSLFSLELQSGKLVEAIKIARQIQAQHDKSPVGFSLEGDALMEQKKFSEATKAYEKAFEISNNGLLAVRVHQATSLAGDVKKADTGLQLWLKGQPNDLIARRYLAQRYMKLAQNKPAIEQYEFILRQEPQNIMALNNLALLYQQEKDTRALLTAEQAFKLNPNEAIIADTLGWILVEQGKTMRAAEILQKAAAIAPKNAEIGYHYAVALVKSGDKTKARKQLEALLATGQSFPQRAQAKDMLAHLPK